MTELLFNGPVAVRLRERLSGESELHAPHLIDLEVLQVLRRALRRGALTEAGAADALADFAELRLTRYLVVTRHPFYLLLRIYGVKGLRWTSRFVA